VKPRKVEVVIPPSPKFRAIEESDEYQPSSSPAAPRQAKGSKSYGWVIKILVFVSACERCKRGKRDCVVDELGTSCMGCKARKYGCSHTGKKDLKTMVVTRSVDKSEEEEEEEEAVEEKKGKKRAAEPPARSKKVVKAKEVKEEKPKPKPTEKKSKGKQRGSDEEEEDAMHADDDDSDEGEQKQKRPRLMHGEHQHKNKLTFS